MKKITLTLCMVFSFALLANAEYDATSQATPKKQHKMMKNQENMDNSKGYQKQHDGKKHECATKCNLDKEKIMSCRKKYMQKHDDKPHGKCLNDEQKECMHKCLGPKSERMNKDDKMEKGEKQRKQRKQKDEIDSQ